MSAGYHSLYSFYHTKEGERFPDPTGLRARMEYWTMGFYPACIKYLMAAFDVPEVFRQRSLTNVHTIKYINTMYNVHAEGGVIRCCSALICLNPLVSSRAYFP